MDDEAKARLEDAIRLLGPEEWNRVKAMSWAEFHQYVADKRAARAEFEQETASMERVAALRERYPDTTEPSEAIRRHVEDQPA